MTITKIYTLMHEYPTLVREIVTPTLSDFARACLQVLKPPASSKVAKAPYSLVETVFESISTLIPLYPTTLREFAGKYRTEIRPFLAPTISDNVLVPNTLRRSSQRLYIRLHMTSSKGGDSTEWTKNIEELVKAVHATADQAFRAVQENWESAIGYKPQPVNLNTEPRGGGGDLDQYPGWVGVQAGGERIIGLLDFIGEYLRCRTRVAVTVPITTLLDITSRISSIKLPVHGKDKSDSGMNPAIGREEMDELWAVFPDIQITSLRLHLLLIQRLEKNYIPIAQESLDQTVRVLQSLYRLPQARTIAFNLVKEIIHLCGLTLPKFTVESLGLLIKCCCRDLLGAAGYLPKPRLQGASTSQNGQKPKTISQDADAFLPGKSQGDVMSISLSADHLSAAETLLTALFSHLPQQHIPSSLRSQMLKTAILSRNKDAQVASVLHPARERSGRTPQVILPYLSRQFPQDESVEILRFNFRPTATGPSGDFMETDDGMIIEEDEELQTGSKATNNGFSFEQGFDTRFSDTFTAPTAAIQPKAPSPNPMRNAESAQTPFRAHPLETTTQPQPPETTMVVEPVAVSTSSLKRKNEDATAEISISKRVEIDATRVSASGIEATVSDSSDATGFPPVSSHAVAATTSKPPAQEAQSGDGESSDDESVHLNMELDSDDDDDEEEEDDE